LIGSLTIPNSVISIGNHAFEYCSGFTGSLTIPNSIISIGDYAFYECSGFTGSLTIPSSVTSIGERAFQRCSGFTGSLTLPNSVKSIGAYSFCECSGFTGSLTLPNTISSIEMYTFYGCSGLTGSLTIPNSVISIGDGAFQNCTQLYRVISKIETPFTISDDFFKKIPSNARLLVPKDSKTLYLSYSGWTKNFAIVAEEGESISFDLTITESGNGGVNYNNSTVRDKTESFVVAEGTSASITFNPDNGYCIANVKVNNTDVTSSVVNNQYTINNITANTTLAVTFEANPPTTYTLSLTAPGNGYASYNGMITRNSTREFTIDEGSSPTIVLNPDKGYRIANVKVNNTDVTSSVVNNQYTISNVTANTTLEVTFEVIPTTKYTLSIKATGNGTVDYNGYSVRDKISSFTVVNGLSATLTISADSGNRIKNVTANSADVTSNVVDGKYTINNVTANTNIEVVFETIPVYTLSIKASGNGYASYNGTIVLSSMYNASVTEGTSATIFFTPDRGYRIKSVKVNGTDVTTSVTNSQYTISNIRANTTLEVEFEALPPTTYTLSVTASGNGYASYNLITIRNNTSTYTVNEGASATITFTPDNGYRIANVKVNNMDVSSIVVNNQYTINNITANTNVEVVFEAIPTYTLTIITAGYGYVDYSGNVIRSQSKSYSVREGSAASMSFVPDAGYRVASIRLNNTDIMPSVVDNQYTISDIRSDVTLTVIFEQMPPTTFTLNISTVGNDYVYCNGTTLRNETHSFTLTEGSSESVTFSPDSGYRIANVILNNTDVTSSVVNNQYTINGINANTSLSVSFEAIPIKTYALIVSAIGNGFASYSDATIRSGIESFTLNEGSDATVYFSPDAGYRIAHVKVNNTDVTADVRDNRYTISNINANTTLEVSFEAIPPTTYALSITAQGNGSAVFNDASVKNRTQSFTVIEGTTAIVFIYPESGNSINSVKLNGEDVTASVLNDQYAISNITTNMTLEVTFEEDITSLALDGVNYTVVSQADKTVIVNGGNVGRVLTIPAQIESYSKTWTVVGIDANALKDKAELCAVIWDPEAAFTATVNNPNLLLYVKDERYAQSNARNIIVNGIADNVTLVEASSGNGFYCPQAFTARQISYSHNYQMQTGINESKGWETLALPFDVQSITHLEKGTIVPFAGWQKGDTARPFWLYELTGNGFVETSSIKAYTPYIISMPNHPQYYEQWLLKGHVTFAASNVTINVTENLQTASYGDRTFIPCFTDKDSNEGLYSLNVNNEYAANNSGMTEGSKFVLNMRKIHPFEAYMMTTSNAPQYAFGIFEGMPTSIQTIVDDINKMRDAVYDLQGRKMNAPVKKGVYITNGRKKIIK